MISAITILLLRNSSINLYDSIRQVAFFANFSDSEIREIILICLITYLSIEFPAHLMWKLLHRDDKSSKD